MKFTEKFFQQNATKIASSLIGVLLCRKLPSGEIKKGIIIETEAYMPNDPASHSFKGQNIRNRSMFLEGGHTYVYLIYGIHYCLNIVTGKEGEGQGVLIRALEMIETNQLDINNKFCKNRTSGPGKICRYLEIDKQHDGLILNVENGIWLEDSLIKQKFLVSCSSRIGISVAQEKKWRFFMSWKA